MNAVRRAAAALLHTQQHSTLSFEAVGASSPHAKLVYILHGLLGEGRNWRSFAKLLSASNPELRVLLVDLRGHGKSSALRLTGPHTLSAAVDDLQALAASTGPPAAVLGHSLGGKVALTWAPLLREGTVWALDSSPGASTEDASAKGDSSADPHGVGRVLSAVKSVGSEHAGRSDAAAALAAAGLSPSLVAWLTSGILSTPRGVRFGFDVDVASKLYDDYRRVDAWGALTHPPPGVDVRLVTAERSGAWAPGSAGRRALDALPAGAARRVHLLRNAGHWLQADNPQGLADIVGPSLAGKRR